MAAPITHELTNRGRQAARSATGHARPWLHRTARLGYVASGLVYLTLGILTLQTALGDGGQTTDSRGAISTLAEQPAGKFLVLLVGIGMLGYAVWRLIAAVTDAEDKGSDTKGMIKRAAQFVSGVLHGLLGVYALRLLAGSPQGSGGGKGATARLMEMPAGRWLVAAVGLGIIAYALYELYKAAKVKLDRQLDLSRVDAHERTWITRAARAGIGARGVVFTIIGGLFVAAAVRYSPSQPTGLDAALATLADAPFGMVLLGLVAVGFMGYAIYQLVRARYRRVSSV